MPGCASRPKGTAPLFFGNMKCCGKVFANEGALARHQYSQHFPDSRPTPAKKKILRHSYTVRFKAAALALMALSLAITCYGCGDFKERPLVEDRLPLHRYRCECGRTDCTSRLRYQRDVANELGISPGTLSEWKKDARRFNELLKDRPKMKRQAVHYQKYPLEEEELYMRFAFRRKRLGLVVDGYWLKSEMLDILAEWKSPGYWTFKLSNGWLYGFLLRFNISYQVKNDKKNLNAFHRLHEIAQFHRSLWEVQTYTWLTGVDHPLYGAFPPENIWNMDHVPLPFTLNLKHSYNAKGERCWIPVFGESGLDKRQATLHITIRAEGPQFMELFVIFKAKSNFKPKQEEIDGLNAVPGVKWAFQRNAWADGDYSMAWLRWFGKRLREEGRTGWQLLLLDDLGAQKTKRFQELALSMKILPWPIPGGCTDVCQPVDDGIGGVLKKIMNKFYKATLEVNINEWREYKKSLALAAPKRRVMMLQWASKGWHCLGENRPLINGAFRHSGALIHKDRSNGATLEKVLANYSPWMTIPVPKM